MQQVSRIYVAGHRGLVGSAIIRRLHKGGYEHIITRTHDELELTDQRAVDTFFNSERPEYVFLAAAKVGGILANSKYPAEFIYRNISIQTHVIHAAFNYQVKKLLFLGSSCIYPRDAPQPLREEYLLTGELESTNEAYAIAKIAGIKMCTAYNRQYGTNFLCAMPTNLYGLGDNYHLSHSHVVPALIRKMHEAKERNDSHVTVWGTGNPRREFLYSDDLADACVFLMERIDAKQVGELINIGVGKDIAIAELADLIAQIVGFHGQIIMDHSKPDGTPQKLLDISKLHRLGWHAKVTLKKGIEAAYRDYLTTLSTEGRSQEAGDRFHRAQ